MRAPTTIYNSPTHMLWKPIWGHFSSPDILWDIIFLTHPPPSHTRPREGVGDVRYICTWYFFPQTNPSSPAWELTIYRVRTSLEPRGMDKMITASKDVINKMDVLHSHYTPPFFHSFTLFPLPLSLKWFDRKWNRGTILVAFCYELVLDLFFGFKFGLDFDLCMI